MAIQYVGARGQAIRTPRASGAASRYGWSFEVSQTDVARIKRKFQRASGKGLYASMQRANLAAGDLIAGRVKQAAPRRTGLLRAAVKSRLEPRKGIGGKSTAVLVGPTAKAHHRHLIISGHRIVTPGGRFTGRRTAPNPFVDRAARGFGPKAAALVMREWKTLLR